MTDKPILIAGAAGYVGGRLTPRLLEAGWRVRAAVRSPTRLACRPWARRPGLEIVQADALDPQAMTAAAQGCQAAYYLIHSMRPGAADFARLDQQAARTFAHACASGGVERIIYLGGLGEDDRDLSEHLRSRLEVARTLAAGPVPVTFLRAAVIIGSGSASFEILRHLVDRLPVMTTPVWVRTKSAPIAVSNVLGYLVGCLERPETIGQTYGVCGPDTLSYGELFEIYRQEAGLRRRLIIPLPLLTPWLSALWIGLVTPVPPVLARPLVEGLRNEAVCHERSIERIIPQPLLPVREAIRQALASPPATCWSDEASQTPPEWTACGDAGYAGGPLRALTCRARVRATPEEAFAPIMRIGGQAGWYGPDWLFGLRGALDGLLGGVGTRRGRRDPDTLRPGDAVDFWRALVVEPPRRLVLLAETKLPGQAVLELTVTPRGDEAEVRATLRFKPRGLAGEAYWRLLAPLDRAVWLKMLDGLVRAVGRPVTLRPEIAPGEVHACG